MTMRSRSLARPAMAVLLATLATTVTACSGGRAGTRPTQTPRNEGATAISSVTEEDFATMRTGRIEEVLMGRVPGLMVLRLANGDYTLRIRGRVSFMGDDEPLLVLDGMPITHGLSRTLAMIDPRDVARVDVLKDAGATAMYGVQGGNGVIVITTRRGR